MTPHNSLRILHFIRSIDLAAGGPVRAVLDLSRGLSERGHEIRIVTGYIDPDSADFPDNDRIKGSVLPATTTPGDFSSLTGIGRDAKPYIDLIQQADVVHFHNVWLPALPRFSRLCRKLGKPYIISLRGMLDDWCMEQRSFKKKVSLALYGTSVLERAAAVHCTAQFELEQSRKWFPKGRGVVIPNLLNLDPYRSPPGPEVARQRFPELLEPRPKVLFLSRVHYKKGADVFVQAIAELARRGTSVRAIVAGPGDLEYIEQLKALVRKAKIEDRVLFTGHVSGDLKVSLYQSCEIFALPTHQENFGFVLPEALAAGAAVVTTKGVDIWPELESSGSVLIADRTPKAFADAIESLLADPQRLSARRAGAPEFVLREFDENRTLDRFESLYRSVIDPNTAL